MVVEYICIVSVTAHWLSVESDINKKYIDDVALAAICRRDKLKSIISNDIEQ